MGFFDSLKQKTSETAAKAMVKAQKASESSRLNLQISDEQKRMDELYYQIGKLYVSQHGSDGEPAFSDLIAQLRNAEQNISEYRQQLEGMSNLRICPNCGAQVPKGSAFCSNCGASMPADENVVPEGMVKCPNCGALVPENTNFCIACGNPIPHITAQPAGQEKVQADIAAPAKRICPNCGAEMEPDSIFCMNCGAKVPPQENQETPEKTGEEISAEAPAAPDDFAAENNEEQPLPETMPEEDYPAETTDEPAENAGTANTWSEEETAETVEEADTGSAENAGTSEEKAAGFAESTEGISREPAGETAEAGWHPAEQEEPPAAETSAEEIWDVKTISGTKQENNNTTSQEEPGSDTGSLAHKKICPNCGAVMDDDALFCTECGTSLRKVDSGNSGHPAPDIPAKKICPNCGAVMEDDAVFCTECGSRLQ